MAIVLSRHRQWTPIDESDIGLSGLSKGTGRWKYGHRRHGGQEYLTNRMLPEEIRRGIEQLQKQYPQGTLKRGTRAYSDYHNRMRNLAIQALKQGYTLADLGREPVVAGGMAMYSNLMPNLGQYGWKWNPQLGTFVHSSWGDDVTWGDYVDQDYQDYLAGLTPEAPPPPDTAGTTGGAGYAGPEAAAAVTGTTPTPTETGGIVAPAAPTPFAPAATSPTPSSPGALYAPQATLKAASPRALTPPPDPWAGVSTAGTSEASPFSSQGGSGNLNAFSNPQFFGGGQRRRSSAGWTGGGQWVTSDERLKTKGLQEPPSRRGISSWRR